MPILPNATSADQLLKTDAALRDCASDAQIGVDHLDVMLLPAELDGALGECVLQLLTLLMVEYLVGTRLSDVDHGTTCQMTRLNQIGNVHGGPPEECGLLLG